MVETWSCLLWRCVSLQFCTGAWALLLHANYLQVCNAIFWI